MYFIGGAIKRKKESPRRRRWWVLVAVVYKVQTRFIESVRAKGTLGGGQTHVGMLGLVNSEEACWVEGHEVALGEQPG